MSDRIAGQCFCSVNDEYEEAFIHGSMIFNRRTGAMRRKLNWELNHVTTRQA